MHIVNGTSYLRIEQAAITPTQVGLKEMWDCHPTK